MSRTTILTVPAKGPIEDYAEYSNAFGSAMYVWQSLAGKYLTRGDSGGIFSVIFDGGGKKLWSLATDPRLTREERIVMACTFDRAMVKKENLAELADCFERFVQLHPPGEKACSLNAQAQTMREIVSKNLDIVGICWIQTSVASDVWIIHGDNDDSRRYDVSIDKTHFFVYDDKDILNGKGK